MARIRTIKPEFWVSEQVMECSPVARLTFIGLWNFCDDGGNHSARAKTLKAEVFPGDDVSQDDVQGWVDELIRNGLVMEYEVDGRQFWHVTGWHHQKVEKPTYKHPPPPTPRPVDDQSTTIPRPVDDQSTTEGKGKERSLRECNGVETERLREAESVDNSKRACQPVDNFQNQKPTADGQQVWWKSDRGIDAMAKQLGVEARTGESYRDLKSRCFNEINRRRRMQA